MSNSKDNSFQGDISRAHDFFNCNFNNNKYKVSTVGPTDTFHVREYLDGTDYLANKQKLVISVQHVPSGRSIFFKAFITAFNETYVSDWSEETVYGRPDPILMFKQTARRLSIAWKIPAGSESEAYENLTKVQQLTQFLYATYEDATEAQTIQQSSLLRLKVMNLAQKSNSDHGPGGVSADEWMRRPAESLYNDYGVASSYASSEGVLGIITSCIVNHNIETDEGAFQKTTNTILPKMMEINLEFSPIHESSLGWSRNKKGKNTFNTPHFPYGALSHNITPPSPPLSPESEEFLENLECTDTPERCAAELKRLRNQARKDNNEAKGLLFIPSIDITFGRKEKGPMLYDANRYADLPDFNDSVLPEIGTDVWSMSKGGPGMGNWHSMDDIGMGGGRYQWPDQGFRSTGQAGYWSDEADAGSQFEFIQED